MSRAPTRRALRGLALVGLVSLGSGLAAIETTARAASADSDAEGVSRQHFQLGELHYAAGEFAAALGEYQAGYDAVPLPGFLVNIAQCQRRLGDLKRARVTYEKFVLVAPDSPLVPEVRVLIRELDRQQEGTAPPAAAALEGADHATSPAPASRPASRPVSPPALVPRLAARGTLASSGGASAGAGAPGGLQLVARRAASESSPPAAPGDAAHPSSSSHWWFWGTLAVVALVGTGAILALAPGGTTTVHDGTLGTLRR